MLKSFNWSCGFRDDTVVSFGDFPLAFTYKPFYSFYTTCLSLTQMCTICNAYNLKELKKVEVPYAAAKIQPYCIIKSGEHFSTS